MLSKPPVPGSGQPLEGAPSGWEDEAKIEEFKPLTREEAQQWRSRQPKDSVWRVVGWQCVLTVLAGLVAWALTQQASVVRSVLYGALCIVLPTALMAYGLTSSRWARRVAQVFPGMARVSLAGVFFWEGVKVLLALTMMWLAPRLVPQLSWLALVAGLVVALKAYWLELWMRSRRST